MEDEARRTLRQIREILVDLIVSLSRLIFFWVPGGDIAIGHSLRVFHPMLVFVILGAFFLSPPRHPMRLLIVCLAIFTAATQWLLSGCIITRAEQKLTNEKHTIVDPFLTLARIPVNRDTRMTATISCGTFGALLLVWAYLCDYLR